MRPFDYALAERIEDAFPSPDADTVPIAGGTELLNWLRLGIAEPRRLVDIGQLSGLDGIERRGEHLRIGALSTLNTIGEHPLVLEHAAALGRACLQAASAQVRNRATLGGNVLQKTRCAYFRAESPLPWGCNKRAPGSGCAARHGLNERMAIFGWTDDCVAVMPSDPLVALAALDAEVELSGPQGLRRLSVGELHLSQQEAAQLGGNDAAARRETRLQAGELILGFQVPIKAGARSAYVKVRERASYEYALVSAAAVLTLGAQGIESAAIALGSVAQKPWRLHEAERALIGQAPTREAVLRILRESLRGARPLEHNAYKIAMSAGAAMRAIVEAGAAP